MLKLEELMNRQSCLNKAEPEEPLFVLRAKDPNAAQTVRLWASMSVNMHEPQKIDGAFMLADQMDKWRQERQPAEQTIGKVVNKYGMARDFAASKE
jgi:hypothetical protein